MKYINILICILVLFLMSFSALGIYEHDIADGTPSSPPPPIPEVSKYIGVEDKGNLIPSNSALNFFRKLFGAQAFSFAQSNLQSSDANTCTEEYTSSFYKTYIGGYDQNGAEVTAGQKCAVGDYILYNVRDQQTKNAVPIFAKLWLKTSKNDYLKFHNEPYTEYMIFEDKTFLLKGAIEVSYSCLKCNVPAPEKLDTTTHQSPAENKEAGVVVPNLVGGLTQDEVDKQIKDALDGYKASEVPFSDNLFSTDTGGYGYYTYSGIVALMLLILIYVVMKKK